MTRHHSRTRSVDLVRDPYLVWEYRIDRQCTNPQDQREDDEGWVPYVNGPVSRVEAVQHLARGHRKYPEATGWRIQGRPTPQDWSTMWQETTTDPTGPTDPLVTEPALPHHGFPRELQEPPTRSAPGTDTRSQARIDWSVAYVAQLPPCDLSDPGPDGPVRCAEAARYDAVLATDPHGRWAYQCQTHWDRTRTGQLGPAQLGPAQLGPEPLGLGLGQRLVVVEQSEIGGEVP